MEQIGARTSAQAGPAAQQAAWSSDALEMPVMVLSYAEERSKRVLYQDKALQLLASPFSSFRH